MLNHWMLKSCTAQKAISFGIVNQEQDSYLHFLYKENFRDRDIFEKGLQCLMSYLFSQPETGVVYLPVPNPESRFYVAITGLAFEISDIDIPFHAAHQTYQI